MTGVEAQLMNPFGDVGVSTSHWLEPKAAHSVGNSDAVLNSLPKSCVGDTLGTPKVRCIQTKPLNSLFSKRPTVRRRF